MQVTLSFSSFDSEPFWLKNYWFDTVNILFCFSNFSELYSADWMIGQKSKQVKGKVASQYHFLS